MNSSNCTKTVVDERDVFVYFTAAEKRAEAQIVEAKSLKHPQKIITESDFVYLAEKNEGIHIIDNRDPKNPVCVKFIEIKGNWDFTIKNKVLYADSYSDLLLFDIKNPLNPKYLRRLEDAFNWDNIIGRYKSAGMEKDMVKEVQHIRKEYLIACNEEIDIENNVSSSVESGSMSRFCINNNFLYAIDNLDLYVFNIQNADNPVLSDKIRVDDHIETIYTYKKRLFIGGLQGVYIFDITANGKPVQSDHFRHIESCDPVIVNDSFAFATMRQESSCRRGKNSLLVLDISDIKKAKLLSDIPMKHPHGLALKDNRLYIANGEHGISVFNTDDKTRIGEALVAEDSSYHSLDILAIRNKPLLLMIGNDGFYEFDITNPDSLYKLGSISAFGN